MMGKSQALQQYTFVAIVGGEEEWGSFWVDGLGAEAEGKVSEPEVHAICIHPLCVWMVESEAHIGCGKGRICVDKCMPLK